MKPLVQALAVVFVLALYALVGDGPTETDALQLSAEIDNSLAAEHAAQHALVASKD